MNSVKLSGTSLQWGTNNGDDDMCVIDDIDDFSVTPSVQLNSTIPTDDINKSFNPMCEPNNDWLCKFEASPEVRTSNVDFFSREDCGAVETFCKGGTEFSFPSEALAEDEEEVTESKIRAFLDEKALELKKLQEEFYSTLNVASPKAFGSMDGNVISNLLSKSSSPLPILKRRLSTTTDVSRNVNPVSDCKPALVQTLCVHSPNFSERQRIWKEELDKELEIDRERLAERLRQAGGKTSSPNKRVSCHQSERLPFASPQK